MDYSEKIKKLNENINKSQEVINKEQTKIKNWKNEIKTCEDLEIKGIINDLNIPYSELKEVLKKLKSNL